MSVFVPLRACVCVALNNEDVMTGAHERVCATACMCMCVSCV